MSWFLFSLLSAVAHTIFNVTSKIALKKINTVVYLGYLYSLTGLVLFGVSLANGLPNIGIHFFGLVILGAVIFGVGAYLWVTALKEGDLSNSIPMLSFVPLFLVLTSFLFLDEKVSMIGLLGILGVVFGAYIVNSKQGEKGLLSPIKNLFYERGPRLMILSAVFFAIGNSIDKLVILQSDPILGASLTQFIAGMIFLFMSVVTRKSLSLKSPNYKSTRALIYSVFLYSISVFTLNQAFAIGIVSYSAAVKFLYIFFTVLAGILFFKEKNSRNRIIGSMIMVAATILLLFA